MILFLWKVHHRKILARVKDFLAIKWNTLHLKSTMEDDAHWIKNDLEV